MASKAGGGGVNGVGGVGSVGGVGGIGGVGGVDGASDVGGVGVICQTRGQTLRLTLNRPDEGNRLTVDMLAAIANAIRGIDDSSVRAVVIDANGPDFCLGGELGRFWEMSLSDIERFANTFIDMLLRIRGCAAPVILSAAGRVWGGGMCLLDAADIAIVSGNVSIAVPEVLGGRPPVLSFMGAYRNIPEKTLMRMALSGEGLGAAEALRLGLVSAVADSAAEQAALCEEYVNMAERASQNPAGVIKELRVAADGSEYERQLRAAGALLPKALLSGQPTGQGGENE
ncbi:MAG: enoyl-CoA hydratase-related protein [Oscillospiraceae bacterium]|nr:enoyl-CoA hydratase-related protein [Oscillospiraceae bacterium]